MGRYLINKGVSIPVERAASHITAHYGNRLGVFNFTFIAFWHAVFLLI
jgi:hypothetical protein